MLCVDACAQEYVFKNVFANTIIIGPYYYDWVCEWVTRSSCGAQQHPRRRAR